MKEYYDSLAGGYDELHGAEQKKKLLIVKEILRPGKDDLLLDVGCGTGLSSDFSCRVIGADPSFGLLKVARGRGLQVVNARAEALPFADSSFDVVVSLTAAQNFSDLEKGILEMKRVGKNAWAISILRRSDKARLFMETISEVFGGARFIEEEKDIIAIIKDEVPDQKKGAVPKH